MQEEQAQPASKPAVVAATVQEPIGLPVVDGSAVVQEPRDAVIEHYTVVPDAAVEGAVAPDDAGVRVTGGGTSADQQLGTNEDVQALLAGVDSDTSPHVAETISTFATATAAATSAVADAAAAADSADLAAPVWGSLASNHSNREPAVRRLLARAPALGLAELQATLEQHREWLSGGGRGGRWSTCVASDRVPFGVYIGAASERGKQANFHLKVLEGLPLADAMLMHAHLSAVRCENTNLGGADLRGALLIDGFFSGSSFAGADLRGADCSRADFIGCDFTGADLRGADLEDADLTGAELSGTRWAGTLVPGAILSSAADLWRKQLLGEADKRGGTGA